MSIARVRDEHRSVEEFERNHPALQVLENTGQISWLGVRGRFPQLAQAQSNRGAGGRKRDFPDAERLVKRLVAQELTLSYVPDVEQRLWRTVMRRKYQITRSRVQLHNRLESLLEEAHIKISSIVSDLLGTSARRMLHAVGDGETDPAALAHWPTSDCEPRPSKCATPSERAWIFIPCIGGW